MPRFSAGSRGPIRPAVIVSSSTKTAATRSSATNGGGMSHPIDARVPVAAAERMPAGTVSAAPIPNTANVSTRVAPHANRYIQNGTGSVYGTTSVWAAAAVEATPSATASAVAAAAHLSEPAVAGVTAEG